MNERLRRETVIDAVTGLFNRRGWELLARPVLEQSQRAGLPVALAVFELDSLEPGGNSSMDGDDDLVGRRFAEDMRMTLRGGDVLAYVGAGRFAALLVDADATGARAALSRLGAAGRPPVRYAKGVSMGQGGDGLEHLTLRSEAALESAKRRSAEGTVPATDPQLVSLVNSSNLGGHK